MNTSKIDIKKINIHGRGTSIYIKKREREHIKARVGEDVIIDMSIPMELRIMTIDRWQKLHGGTNDAI